MDSTFGQFLECKWLLLLIHSFILQEIILLCRDGELCAFTLALLLPLLGQRLGQKKERDTGQQDHSSSYYEAEPPGPHPAGVHVVDGDTVWRPDEIKR